MKTNNMYKQDICIKIKIHEFYPKKFCGLLQRPGDQVGTRVI